MLEFGIYMSIIGTLFVFSALSIIMIVCWVLKKAYKERIPRVREDAISQQETANDAVLKVVAMAAAIQVFETLQEKQRVLQSPRAVQSNAWVMAGRMEQLGGKHP